MGTSVGARGETCEGILLGRVVGAPVGASDGDVGTWVGEGASRPSSAQHRAMAPVSDSTVHEVPSGDKLEPRVTW